MKKLSAKARRAGRRIGRVSRGFDFPGIDFQPSAPLAASAVGRARHTENIARLDEQGGFTAAFASPSPPPPGGAPHSAGAMILLIPLPHRHHGSREF